MSDTQKLPDECKRLLDNGWMIALFKSELGDYTALALRGGHSTNESRAILAVIGALKVVRDNQVTGDFEPSQALTRLTEKVFGCEVGSGAEEGPGKHP